MKFLTWHFDPSPSSSEKINIMNHHNHHHTLKFLPQLPLTAGSKPNLGQLCFVVLYASHLNLSGKDGGHFYTWFTVGTLKSQGRYVEPLKTVQPPQSASFAQLPWHWSWVRGKCKVPASCARMAGSLSPDLNPWLLSHIHSYFRTIPNRIPPPHLSHSLVIFDEFF